MATVQALQSFEHGGPRKRNDVFEVSDAHAAALKKANLVRMMGSSVDPEMAAGEAQPSSASRAAQASQQTTAKKSAAGVKRRQRPDE